MKKHRNWLNYEQQPGKTFEMASLTVPDQTLTIKEMLRCHAAGIPMNGNGNPYFDEESQGLDVRKLDLVDLQRLKQENQVRVQELKEVAANEAAEAKNRKRQRKVEEAKAILAEIIPPGSEQ